MDNSLLISDVLLLFVSLLNESIVGGRAFNTGPLRKKAHKYVKILWHVTILTMPLTHKVFSSYLLNMFDVYITVTTIELNATPKQCTF